MVVALQDLAEPDSQDKAEINQENIDINIFPNPASQWLNIGFGNVGLETSATIEMADALGRKVYFHKVELEAEIGFQIDVSQFAVGQYLVRINTEQQTFTKQISIVR